MSSDSEYHFTDENANIFQGEEARARLQKVNDLAFLSTDQGIVQVSKDRWLTAQRFEKTGWMEKWRGAIDDRNYDHLAGFDSYTVLKNQTFQTAVELGCGPFTNSRLIGSRCDIKAISLLDPLIYDYMTLENASCDRSQLKTSRRLLQWSMPRKSFLQRLIGKLGRTFPILGEKKIPVKEIFPMAIEDMPKREAAYDLVILINVIEHCFDLPKILEKILEMCRSGGVFVFHDHLYQHDVVKKMVDGRHYEAGHPLMADEKLIKEFCQKHFNTLFERSATEPVENHPILKEHSTYYFIGKLKEH